MPRESSDPAPFAYEGLDRVLHEKARLGILSSLMANPNGLLFTELKELCDLTDGNLARHMQTLQEAGLVEVWKKTEGKRPQTLVRMTDAGRERFMEYIGLLEQIVGDALDSAKASRRASKAKHSDLGWSPG